jgi:acyl-CoA reductase-like NAD-dependent aldehyde dehydrogenase
MHVPKIIFGMLHPFRRAAGTRCVGPERIMEHRELYDEFSFNFHRIGGIVAVIRNR